MVAMNRIITTTLHSPDRRLQRAVEYVSDHWMPCDQQLLSQINRILSGKQRDDSLEQALSCIRSDVSLYLFTLQRFYKLLAAEGVQIDEELSSNEFIMEGGIDLLQLIFQEQELLRTPHALETGDDAQRLRIFESLVSASSAQMLAPTFGIDATEGYSGALIRQLGLLLIAWNYPTAYAQALRAERKGMSLNEALSEKLGFTPEMLTVELLHRWGISRTVSQHAFGLSSKVSDGAESNALVELYAASEMLARANLPELYPDARDDWGKAKSEVLKRLGSGGMDAIQSVLEEHLSHYRKNIPTLFSPGLVLDPARRISTIERAAVLDSNPYLPLCADAIRESFQRIYNTASQTGQQEWVLRQILRQLIPQAGFHKGCVFTVDPDRLKLTPQVAIGSAKRQDFRRFDLSASGNSHEIVGLAYSSPQPIIEYHLDQSGRCVNYIASFIGLRNRIGVLYLEIDGDLYDINSAQVLNQFKAIQYALSECLTV